MSKDIKVIIMQQKIAGKIGFGIPLILQGMDTTAKEYKECQTIDEVKLLFAEDTAVYKAAALIFSQMDAPKKIAVCSSTERVTSAIDKVWNKEWRQLIVTSVDTEGEDTVKAVSDYIEAKGDKIYFASVPEVAELSNLTKNDRTFIMVYKGTTEIPEAAVVGATSSLAAGSFTYKNMVLKGIAPEELSDPQIKAIHDGGGYCFVTKAGDNVTSEGKTMGGEYLDIIDSKDWIVKNIEFQAQSLLNQSKKVPYTDAGIAQMESVVINVLKEAYGNGMIADTEDGLPAFSTSFAKRADTPIEDKATRSYNGGKFSFTIAGAIHDAIIQGELVF